MTKPKVAPKPIIEALPVAPRKIPVRVKTVEADTSEVTLKSYSIKMVIPTGQYANIQPEIVVKAYSVEKAHDFIAPHMNKLWKEYYLVNERRPEPPKPQVGAIVSTSTTATTATGITNTTPTIAPGITYLDAGKKATPDTVPLAEVDNTAVNNLVINKAIQAIEACESLDAFEIIKSQIEKSVKLTIADKEKLKPALKARFELFRPMSVDEVVAATGGKVIEPAQKKMEDMTVDEIFPDEPSPASSVAFNKATQAIDACMSLDALEIIRSQIDKSVKLTKEDKEKLQPSLMARFETLSDGF